MKFKIFLIAGTLATVFCKEWDIVNTGIPISQGIGSDSLWIVSEQSFNRLNRNSSVDWRVASGANILQAEIIQGKGIVYLSRENHISKLGLRSLEQGSLKWEITVGNISKFHCQEYIYLDDNTMLNFGGSKVEEKVYAEIKDKSDPMELSKNVLKIGSQKFEYDVHEFGEPHLYEISGKDLLLSSQSGLVLFYKDLELIWTRDESLTLVVTSAFVKVNDENRWVAVTELGTIVALDASTGSKIWRLYFKNHKFNFISVSETDDESFLNVCSLKECIRINARNGEYKYILKDADLIIVSLLDSQKGDLKEQGFAMVDSKLMVSVFADTERMKESFKNSSFYFYTGIEKGSKSIAGYHVESDSKQVSGKYVSTKAWNINLPDSEVIIAACSNKKNGPIASYGRVLGDRSVLYKYLNPNLVAFMTETTLSDPVHSVQVTFYLIDVVSGAIHYRAIHPGGGRIPGKDNSVQILLSENFAIYTYWNHGIENGREFLTDSFINETIPNNKGMEVVVLELYESEKPDKKSPGDHFSSFSSFSPFIISGAFVFPFPIESIGITRTVSGITSKQILFGLSSGQVYGVGRKVLDPRRPMELTFNDKEEELLPYSPVLEYRALNSITRLKVASKWITSCPMHLESSSLVIVGGLDIVCRIVHPSSNFDILSDDFNFFGLIGTIVVLAAVTIAAKIGADKKQLKNMWH